MHIAFILKAHYTVYFDIPVTFICVTVFPKICKNFIMGVKFIHQTHKTTQCNALKRNK